MLKYEVIVYLIHSKYLHVCLRIYLLYDKTGTMDMSIAFFFISINIEP